MKTKIPIPAEVAKAMAAQQALIRVYRAKVVRYSQSQLEESRAYLERQRATRR